MCRHGISISRDEEDVGASVSFATQVVKLGTSNTSKVEYDEKEITGASLLVVSRGRRHLSSSTGKKKKKNLSTARRQNFRTI